MQYSLSSSKSTAGFTLIELVIIIVVIGIISVVAIAKYSDFVEQSKLKASQSEMVAIKHAIIGDAKVVAAGRYVDRGFLGDVGHPPGNLAELVHKPDSLSSYNAIARRGWNGPYLDSANGDYLKDAWGADYVYDPTARTIKSVGSGSEVTVSF
jgi:type II secretory pathway pseudopilin PulG